MATGPRYKVPFRRRREGRTDYRQRQRLLRGRVPRAVVRTSLRNVSVQIVGFDPKGDEVIASAHSRELRGMGWEKATGNLPAAYLVGYLAGKRAVKAGVESSVLDIGLKEPSKGASAFAALKGLLDAGIEVPHGDEVLPSDERIHGDHISPEMRKLVEDIKIKMEAD
jgi:large subunit ribosomal protein L18